MATTLSTRLLAATAALALFGAACSSGDESDPIAERELEEFQSTTTNPPPTDAPPETAASGTTTTTVAPTTTEVTTTIAVVPVTDAPTTTSDLPADPRDAEIAAAIQEFNDSWVRCAEASPNCDPAILATITAEPQLSASAAVVTAGNTNRETITNLDSYRTQLQSIDYLSDTTAEAKVCNEDGLIVTGPTGDIVDDEFVSALTIWQLELLDGSWKITTGRDLLVRSGLDETLCEF